MVKMEGVAYYRVSSSSLINWISYVRWSSIAPFTITTSTECRQTSSDSIIAILDTRTNCTPGEEVGIERKVSLSVFNSP